MLEAFPAILQVGHISPKVVLKLSNPTCAGLDVEEVRMPEWLSPSGPTPRRIEAGSSVTFTARAATSGLKEAVFDDVAATTPAGIAIARMMAIREEPVLFTSPAEIEFWAAPETLSKTIAFQVAPPKGYLSVRRVSAPDDRWLRPEADRALPAIVSATEPLPVKAEVLQKLIGAQAKPTARLEVEYDGAHGPATVSVELAVLHRRPPAMEWTGQHRPPMELKQSEGQPLVFPLANRSEQESGGGRWNGTLIIQEAQLRPLEDAPARPARLVSPLPLEIEGGGMRDLEFEANLEELEPGLHRFELDVRTNHPAIDRVYTVTVNVSPLADFDGVIAIDFGTSNTCCAVLENGGLVESIRLERTAATSATAIRYVDLTGETPEVQAGTGVYDLAAANEVVAAGTVTRLKQQLGEKSHALMIRPERPPEWVGREAREAAADYLRFIRVVAEKQKGALYREFVLTHPAVCSLRQYRNLRLALRQAFGEAAQVQFLQEPMAALAPFFKSRAEDTAAEGYTVAAFDIGGGTTDITVVSVEHRQNGSGLSIAPRIVASWGERFGGEDLTDYLVGELRPRVQEWIERQYPETRLALAGVSGATTGAIRLNEMRLRQAAERIKAGLSDEGRESKADSVLLMVVTDDAAKPLDELSISFSELPGGRKDLEELFLGRLDREIRRLAEPLKRVAASLPRLNYIHLSGKTSFLPDVADALSECFPGAEIVRAADPKVCVVEGACLSRSMARSRKQRLAMPTETQRTTSRLGLMDEDTQTFIEALPMDCPIPETGLTRELEAGWGGHEPIVIWENLGFEDGRMLPDGRANPHLKKLGTWIPERTSDLPSGEWAALQLTLDADFNLRVMAKCSATETICFKPRAAGDAR